ncbi:MAG TPA: hypothetical protein VGE01_07645 [Fimbriimonas sp.]
MAMIDAFVRIIELPAVRMVRSGTSPLGEFDAWWSSIPVPPRSNLCPRDWMWFNPLNRALEWLYVLPEGFQDTGGFEEFDFPGGLYAVAACRDDEASMAEASRAIRAWLAKSSVFEEDLTTTGPGARHEMGRVTTPVNAKQTLGYHQADIYVLIRLIPDDEK